MLNASFARFVAPVVAFKEEGVPSQRLGRREFTSVSETTEVAGEKRRGAQDARTDPNLSKGRRRSCHHMPRPFGGGDSVRGQDVCGDRLIIGLLRILRCLT